MRPVVTVVDYGRSNLLSVRRALEHCGADVRFAAEPGDILRAGALVLPGVGAFADGMAQLHRQHLVEPLLQKAGAVSYTHLDVYKRQVQYHPEFKSRPDKPQPIFRDFVAAALDHQNA